VLLLLAACGPQEPGRDPSRVEVERIPDRDHWFKVATTRPSGAERVLAPREMRALLREGERYGFADDPSWWKPKTDWVYDRILELDPDDAEANAGKGYKTLQSYPGFKALWVAMLETRVTTPDIDHLIEIYDHRVSAGQPIFLRNDAHAIETARLGRAKEHLDKLRADPEYEALQVALARVRGSSLNDYPFVHLAAGPYLIFYCARDLQTIEGEDEAAESARVEARREVYKRRLKKLAPLYTGLVNDVRTNYPAIWKLHKSRRARIHYQWIFAERDWYQEYLERINKEQPESEYRTGFFDRSTGWAYLHEPPEPDKPGPDTGNHGDATQLETPDREQWLQETAAYLAARQLLYFWGKDPDAPRNRLDRSRAYWLKEGWPSHMASLRVKQPLVGRIVGRAKGNNMVFPPLSRVVERESRLELQLYREPRHEFGEDEEDRPQLMVRRSFTDLSCLLVRYLGAEGRRATFEAYLLAQVSGVKPGLSDFEKSFSIGGEAGWARLQRSVYGLIGK